MRIEFSRCCRIWWTRSSFVIRLVAILFVTSEGESLETADNSLCAFWGHQKKRQLQRKNECKNHFGESPHVIAHAFTSVSTGLSFVGGMTQTTPGKGL
jgi:hypothetical protein